MTAAPKRERKRGACRIEDFAEGDLVRFPDGPPMVHHGVAIGFAPSARGRVAFFVCDAPMVRFRLTPGWSDPICVTTGSRAKLDEAE